MSFKLLIISRILFLWLTALFHAMSLFAEPAPTNDTERQLLDLVTTYRMNAGAGFNPTWMDLFTALSTCFSLVCLFGGLLNLFLWRQQAEDYLWRGVLNIELVVYGIMLAVMARFTFLPPIVLSALIFLAVFLARIKIKPLKNAEV